jgi:hypothetical protein
LVEQIWSPLLAHNEMANQDRQSVIAKIATIETYAQQFEGLYSGGLSEHSLGLAWPLINGRYYRAIPILIVGTLKTAPCRSITILQKRL